MFLLSEQFLVSKHLDEQLWPNVLIIEIPLYPNTTTTLLLLHIIVLTSSNDTDGDDNYTCVWSDNTNVTCINVHACPYTFFYTCTGLIFSTYIICNMMM